MTSFEEEVRSRGHWWIVIHPLMYIADRVDLGGLEGILRRSQVQLRGWDFPHMSERDPIRSRVKSIAGLTDWQYYRELWRFYQSGQFTYLIGIHEDWIDHVDGSLGTRWGPPEYLKKRGPLLGVGDTLFRLTEIFEFASRLAITPAGGDVMSVKIELHGLRDRLLWVDSAHRSAMQHDYRAEIDTLPIQRDFSTPELAASAWDIASKTAVEVFSRFGWRPPLELMREQQDELRLIRRA